MYISKLSEQEVRNKITLISFFSCLLVMWMHTFNLVTYGIDNRPEGFAGFVWRVEVTVSGLTQVAVPFFFLISGFLFFRSFEIKKLGGKYLSRVKSILIPYIIWCTLYYMYYVILTNVSVFRSFVSAETVPLSLTRWLSALWPDAYYTLWFLQSLMILILFCPVLYFVLKNKYVGGAVLLFLIVNTQFVIVNIPISGLLYYTTGAYIALNFKDVVFFKSRVTTVTGCLVLLIMAVTGFLFLQNDNLVLLMFFATWFAFDLFDLAKEYPWWMKITFFVYVTNDLFLEMFEKIFLILFGKRTMFALFDYILAPITVFVLLVAIAVFLKHFTPRMWKVITGARG